MNDSSKTFDCGSTKDETEKNNELKNEDSTVNESCVKKVKEECAEAVEKKTGCTELKQINKEVRLGGKKKWLLDAAGWPEDTQRTEMLLQLQEAFNYEGRSLRTVEMMKQLVRLCCSEKELEERIFALETDYIQHTQISGACLLRGYESFFLSTKQGDASGRSQKPKQTFLQETSKDRLFSLTSVTSPLCDQDKFKTWNCFPVSSVVCEGKGKQCQSKTSTTLGLERNIGADISSAETTPVSISKGAQSFVQKHVKSSGKCNHKKHAGSSSRGSNRANKACLKSCSNISKAEIDSRVSKNISTSTNNITVDSRSRDKNVQRHTENTDNICKITLSQNVKSNDKNDNNFNSQLLSQREECSTSYFASKDKHEADNIATNFLKKEEKFQTSNNNNVVRQNNHFRFSSSGDYNEEHISSSSGNLSALKIKRHRRKF